MSTTKEIAWALMQMLDGVALHDLHGILVLPEDECRRIWSAREAARAALDAEPAGEGASAADLLPVEPPNIQTTMAMQYRSAWREGVEDGWNEARAILARLARPAAPAAPEPGEVQRDAVIAAVTEALGNAYDCLRVWEAWSVGTMGQDDFALVAEDSDRVAEIADAAIEAMRPATPAALEAVEAWLAGQAAEEVAL